jgi:hypothetical protein
VRSVALGALALAVLGMGGACEDKHVGRPCELGTTGAMGGGSGQIATISSPALECPSRICLLPGNEKGTDTGPLCTASCEDNSDCEDGEDRQFERPERPPLQERLRLHVAHRPRRRLRLSEVLRLPRLRLRATGGFTQPADCK